MNAISPLATASSDRPAPIIPGSPPNPTLADTLPTTGNVRIASVQHAPFPLAAKLARPVSVHPTARIDCPWNLEMGAFASLGEDSWVYSLARIVIGEYACV